MTWLVLLLFGLVILHAFLSLKYNYDWIGVTTKRWLMPRRGTASVTELYPIPKTPYMDRFGSFTRVPKMKENRF
jgi:hypothetical protein